MVRQTGDRYMQVALAFQNAHSERFAGLTIDASAFYVLAASDVPPDARDEAVERAESGEHVTKEVAEETVARVRAEQERVLRDTLLEYQANEEARRQAARRLVVFAVGQRRPWPAASSPRYTHAYDIACRNDLVDPTDSDAVACRCSAPGRGPTS
jgi:hypothetical protein